MNTAIRCTDLVKTYPGRPPVEAVRGLNLTVNIGECFGLLGPNGAGKTTTMEILEGILPPTAGNVEILGLVWGQDDIAIKERVGISLQETKLAEKLTVRETIRMFRSFYRTGLTPDEAIARVSLEEKAEAWFEKLSGGQRQRLAVACALVGDPELLFLDEPTTGLDPQSRRQLWDVIRDFQGRGRTVMLTTHYMDEAERLCDRVGVVDHGQVIALGTPSELIAKLGGEHVIEFEVDGDVATVAKSLTGLPSVNSVRPDGNGFSLAVTEPHIALPVLLTRLQSLGRNVLRLSTRHVSLEDVFVALTGRHLRDDEPAK